MTLLAHIILWLVWGYLSFFTALLLLFAVAGLFPARDRFLTTPHRLRLALLIPAYKEDRVITATAAAALEQDYPASHFQVIVIADSLQEETLQKLKQLPIRLIEVSFAESTKAKAINRTLELVPDGEFDGVVILDADNVMAPDFLSQINRALAHGAQAVQGHRTAKNLDTSMAVLDALSEEINNHLFRRGHRALGLSAALIGSGMAFPYAFHKELMQSITAVGGFDKEMELALLKSGVKILYLEDALLYDEKVATARAFTRQRQRWLAAQGHYFRRSFGDALRHLALRGNLDYFNKALQMIQPPRILLAGLLFILMPLALVAGSPVLTWTWTTTLLACIAALLLAIPRPFYNRRTLTAAARLPWGFFLMIKALLLSKGANKRFLHTEHTHSGPEQ